MFASHTAKNFLMSYPDTSNLTAGYIFIASWILQIIGHAFAEKRAPAFLDNVFQAFVLAPFFVFLEILLFFGYRPKEKLKLDIAIQKKIEKFKRI